MVPLCHERAVVPGSRSSAQRWHLCVGLWFLSGCTRQYPGSSWPSCCPGPELMVLVPGLGGARHQHLPRLLWVRAFSCMGVTVEPRFWASLFSFCMARGLPGCPAGWCEGGSFAVTGPAAGRGVLGHALLLPRLRLQRCVGAGPAAPPCVPDTDSLHVPACTSPS